MRVTRRFVLKGMALSSLAMTSSVGALVGSNAGPTAKVTDRPILALINEGVAESVFLRGAMAASGSRLQVQTVGRDLGFMLNFEHQLRSVQPMRVIGLLDDASAVLVVDMARSSGARVQWIGQHTAEAGFSRHHLLTTDIAEGSCRQLSRQLHACGVGFSLNEERHSGSMTPRQLAGPARKGNQSTQWAASLGYLLASLGARPALTAPLVATASKPITGSFVSFSIET